jgi:hypothetical protein
VAFFLTLKNDRQNTTISTHFTTFLPSKNHRQTPVFSEIPVSDAEAHEVREWLNQKKMTFNTGSVEATDLTDTQIHLQCKMYIAAVRMAHAFGCDAIGIQYQQGEGNRAEWRVGWS